MQLGKISVLIILLLTVVQTNIFAQTFENIEKAKKYFYNLDDRFNTAMSTKDSTFFNNIFSDGVCKHVTYEI